MSFDLERLKTHNGPVGPEL